jgi:hypothetical protein
MMSLHSISGVVCRLLSIYLLDFDFLYLGTTKVPFVYENQYPTLARLATFSLFLRQVQALSVSLTLLVTPAITDGAL